jgi:hypothetical protein
MLASLGRNVWKLSGSSRFLFATKLNSLSTQSDSSQDKSLYSLSDEELQMKETGNYFINKFFLFIRFI